MEEFLTFLFFAIIAMWLVGQIFRVSVRRWIGRRTEAFNSATREAEKEAKRRGKREGEVTVEATEAAFTKKVSRDVGDYVEFEEVVEETETTEG